MESRHKSAVRDALVSALAAMLVAAVVLVLWAYKVYWALGLVGVGVVAFVVALCFHPSRFYKRVVWACLGLIPLFGAVPALRAAGVFGQDSAFVVIVDSIGTGGFLGLCLLCVVALVVCAVMDYVRTRNGSQKDRGPRRQGGRDGTRTTKVEQHVVSADRSPSVGYAERVEIHYEPREGPSEQVKPGAAAQQSQEQAEPRGRRVRLGWVGRR